MKSTSEIRQTFLDYFAERDHQVVASSSLVPGNDPTLLFTNSGMVQFKDVFLGADKRSYKRAVSSQRCVRAGGKHNDLDQVGYTARHHTFFEMLGNFSFGDYFKHDAIVMAWELLTDYYDLPPERLWVTVYQTDDEAFDIWRDQIGVPEKRIIRVGDKPGGKPYESDNFWAMGDTGPCGPCTEIFFDHGPGVEGGPPGSAEEDGDRYIEIWNLVFMQFDRDDSGNFSPLPKPCVDTGMGLERLTAVLQGVHSNYQIDLFKTLIRSAAEVTACKDLENTSLNVIADHIRACSFLIIDGVLPANEGRGYVLRRIIRRAVRYGYKLGMKKPFFSELVAPLAVEMGAAYSELPAKADLISGVLLKEELRFAETLEQGMDLLERAITDLPDKCIPGATIFKLYDTYGFPVDLVADIARERGLTVDHDGFNLAMDRQRERARAAGRFREDSQVSVEAMHGLPETRFEGYEAVATEAAKIVGIVADGKLLDALDKGESGIVILDRTPFYAESGGQVGDRGRLLADGTEFTVEDTQILAGSFHGHYGQVSAGGLKTGQNLTAVIDHERRQAIVAHHSATHLMQAALRDVLGDHVEQKGSLVTADRLRFDFSHFEPVTPQQLHAIERLVNEQIRGNAPSQADVMPYDAAIETGATALFGEKYGDEVRVMRFGDFSVEFCGGTHVNSVGDIGLFKIISETGIAAGIRRIEALAGAAAIDWMLELESRQRRLGQLLKTTPEAIEQKLALLLDANRNLDKELTRLKARLTSSAGQDLADQAELVGDITLVSARLENADASSLREAVDDLKSRLKSGIIVLGAVDDGKVLLVAGVTKDLAKRFPAGEVVNFVAGQVGGKGGGRPDLAQAGGNEASALPAALASVKGWLLKKN